jgi:hypothetical protein
MSADRRDRRCSDVADHSFTFACDVVIQLGTIFATCLELSKLMKDHDFIRAVPQVV